MRSDTASKTILASAIGVAVVAVGALWAVRSSDRVCIEIYPPPPGCGADEPMWVPVVGIAVVLVLLASHIVAYFTTAGTRRLALQWVFSIGMVVAFAVCALVVIAANAGVFDPPYPLPVEY